MAYTINTGSNGGTYNANVNLSNGCGGSSVTFQSTVTWIHVNGKAFTVDSTTSSRTGDIKTFITPEGGTRTECPNHKITVEQEGVPCGCGSFTFTDFKTSIPQAGLGVNTIIFKCSSNDGCSLDGISGALTIGSTTYNLSIRDNGNAVLQNAVTANTATTSISATIKALYNGNVCETRNIEQEGTGCGCGSFNTFNASIPLTGLTGGSQVGTYVRTNNLCDETDLEVKLVGNGHTYNLVCSGGKMNLATSDTIHGNTGTGSIPFTLSWEYKNTPCDSKEVIQPGTGCDCGTVLMGDTFSVAIPNAGVAGGVQCGTYTKDNTSCSDSDLSATLVGGGSTYHLTFSNNKVYLENGETIPRNGDADGINYTVNWSFQNNPCNSFTVTQPGTGCGCGALDNIVFNDIPSTGASSGWQIGSYTANSSCQFTFVEQNNAFTMSSNNGGIFLSSNVTGNTGYTPIEYVIKTNYGSQECTSHTISQEGTLECNCNSITKMVTLRKRTFPNSGTSAWGDVGAGEGWIKVATGDTYGCGSLSALSESIMFKEEGGSRVKVVDNGNDQYTFYVYVKPNNTILDRSGALDLYFKRKGDTEYSDCNTSLSVWQTVNYCDCDNAPTIEFFDSIIETSGSSKIRKMYMESDNVAFKCYSAKINANGHPSWITPLPVERRSFSTYYRDDLYMSVEENTGATRSGTVYVDIYVDADENGNGGISCFPPTAVKIQQRGVECDCENKGNFDYLGYKTYKVVNLPYTGSEDYEMEYRLDCGVLSYEFDETEDHSWISITIDNENKIVHVNYQKNVGEQRSAYIIFNVTIDGVDCEVNHRLEFRQEEGFDCEDCEAVKESIRDWILDTRDTEVNFAAVYDKYNVCGTISATTTDPVVTGITYSHSDFINGTLVKAQMTKNETGSPRSINFNVFFIDENGNIIPDQNCIKELTVVQDNYYIDCECENATGLNFSQIVNAITAGTHTTVENALKVATVSLKPRNDHYLTDCLVVSASSTHQEFTNVWHDSSDNGVYVTIAEEVCGDPQQTHTLRVDINVLDSSSSEPVQCDNLVKSFEIKLTPNVPCPQNNNE